MLRPAARLALAALVIEAVVGYPDRVHRRAPHPVVGLGAVIGAGERRLNRSDLSPRRRRAGGIATLLAAVGAAAVAGVAASRLPRPGPVLAATIGLAQRSLYDHVEAVARALDADDLPAARAAVGKIVGRDTEALDRSGVAAAAIESLAESFNDGVVAPAFWLLLAGLPGLYAYKAVNTADSLIGHREPRWKDFGWAAARTDDLMNLIPARLAGALIAAASGRGWRTMFRDARLHASPNAGWPEAAMAGALGVRLGGPVAYDGVMTERPTFGEGPPPTPGDLRRALGAYVRACGLLWAAIAIGGASWRR
ncbi:adenosylcobinamide-phosphate synthase CbiB [Phenylobacterium sp.]|uniref:adenosylcobinamide-phosphate synthase CbiB n=1 Tax=Phenylobacterium sp. TaxID=1871053 RepID=UPI002730621A|nr:adenosylcobinamide-phosphate synthase CbiB [Phenylobacterium sp.]MDP1619251.1 adenosylcobinamide-phosphate synthase CbiB [Phenylobacterium sp.]MDP1989125.1 adenosylcobinamide-phosphate synthase CbiB [Phenylobacterium sp.]